MRLYNGINYKVSIIAAVADDNVIGEANDMPWRQPADLKYFRNLTIGHVIIMGRKTQTSLGIPLDRRVNIVVSRNKNYEADGFVVFNDLKLAIDYAIAQDYKLIEYYAGKYTDREIFIIGGQSIYEQAMSYADTLYITEIYANFDGDTYFPDIDLSKYKLISAIDHDSDDKNEHAYCFLKYSRISF